MRLAITGVSGYLGGKAVSVLARETAITHMLGMDLASPRFSSEKFEFVHMDVRSSNMVRLLKEAGINALLHLAWIFNPSHDSRLMYDVNVNGTLNVMTACRQAGVGHIVLAGSTTCYGASPDNPPWLEEGSPLRGSSSFPYSHHKVLVERFCDEFEKGNPEIALTRLRACIVLGRNVDNFVRTLILMKGWRHALVRGHNPEIQFLHEDDIASLLRLVLVGRVGGIYNVAPDDALPIHQVAEITDNPVHQYPYWLLRPISALLWSARLLPVPASYLPFIMYRWTASNARIKAELGWHPLHCSYEALASVPGIGRATP